MVSVRLVFAVFVLLALGLVTAGPAMAGSIAYVAGAQTIYRIDVESGSVLGTLTPTTALPAGFIYEGLSLTPDGRTLVASSGINCCGRAGDAGRVLLFDTATLIERATVVVGARPRQGAITADSRTAYIPAHNSDRIEVIDLTTGAVLRSIVAGPAPTHVDLTSDQTILGVNQDPGGLNNAFLRSMSTATETFTATAGVADGDKFDIVPGTHIAWVSENHHLTLRIVDLDTGAFIDGGAITVGTGGYIKVRPQGDMMAVTGKGTCRNSRRFTSSTLCRGRRSVAPSHFPASGTEWISPRTVGLRSVRSTGAAARSTARLSSMSRLAPSRTCRSPKKPSMSRCRPCQRPCQSRQACSCLRLVSPRWAIGCAPGESSGPGALRGSKTRARGGAASRRVGSWNRESQRTSRGERIEWGGFAQSAPAAMDSGRDDGG